MNDQSNQIQFDSDLTDALSADDVVAVLGELSRCYAGDAEAGELICSARQVVSELVSIGERLAAEPVPTMPKLDLRLRRIRPWWIAVPAAAAVAAAVILAVVLTGPTTPVKSENGGQTPPAAAQAPQSLSEALEVAGAFEFPFPVSPPWPSLEMPAITTPTVGGFSNKEFSIPAFTWPQTTQRSTNNET